MTMSNIIEEKWLVNLPYKGFSESIVRWYADGTNKVCFTEFTLEEYYVEHPERKAWALLTWDELDVHIQAHEQSLIGDVVEVDKERYWEMLEVLPPERWGTHKGVESFHVCEHLTGNLVAWFGQIHDKYFEFTDSCFAKDDDISEKIFRAWEKAHG
jgi:hypothetical protein